MRIWILIIITPLLVTFSGVVEKPIVYEPIIQVVEKEYAHESVKALDELYANIINPVVRRFGGIFITSIYRCDKNSQHYKNEALYMDFDLVDGASNNDLFEFIRDSLAYDQLIIYHRGKHMSHVHASFRKDNNRFEILRAYRWKGRVWYKRLN